MKQTSLLLLLALLLSGCTLKTVELKSDLVVDEEQYLHVNTHKQPIQEQWWKEFGSESLNALVLEMLEYNHDMLSAYEKLNQARLQLGIDKTALYPNASLAASTSSKRNASHIDEGNWENTRASSLSMGLNYEIDLWKKIEATMKISEANFRATQYDWDALRLSLTATIVSSYLQYIALEERRVIAQQNLQSAQKLLEIIEAKYAEGSVSEVDVSRQKTTLLSQESALISLTQSQQELFHAMAVLCGKKPEKFSMQKEPLDRILFPEVTVGMPSNLLLKRPDIASIRAQIEAAEASIYSTYVKRFPSFSLSGTAGLASNVLLGLTDSSGSFSSALGMSYSLFDAGKTDREVSLQESKGKSLLLTYEKSVITALKEVENALYALEINVQKDEIQRMLLRESERSFELAKERYTFGSSDFATLIDAQRMMYQVKDQTVQQHLSKILATVEMYKVLGGGWKAKDQSFFVN